MEVEEYRRMAELQDRHWWFEAKRRVVRAALARFRGDGVGAGERPDWALEVGCGTGAMLGLMAEHGRPLGVDAYLPGLRHIDGVAGVERVAGDLLHLPIVDRSVGLVGCFDVLYHQNVGDVAAALREIRRVLVPGGLLVVTDSAFPSLRSSHDVATHGARRFRLRPLCQLVEAAGLEVVHRTYFHTLLFPIAAAVRWTKRLLHGSPPLETDAAAPSPCGWTGDAPAPGGVVAGAPARGGAAGDGSAGSARSVPARSDLAELPAWLNGLLVAIYRVEAPLVARARMPFGVSLLVVTRRPSI